MRVDYGFDEAALNRFDQLLEQAAARAKDMRPALDAVGNDFLYVEDLIFRTQGGEAGAAWRANSAKWQRAKRRRGLSTRILEMAPEGQVGRLRRSLTRRGAPWAVRNVQPGELVAGTNLPIARIHQTGGTVTIGRGGNRRTVRIPRRRFLAGRREHRLRWLPILEGYAVEGETRP